MADPEINQTTTSQAVDIGKLQILLEVFMKSMNEKIEDIKTHVKKFIERTEKNEHQIDKINSRLTVIEGTLKKSEEETKARLASFRRLWISIISGTALIVVGFLGDIVWRMPSKNIITLPSSSIKKPNIYAGLANSNSKDQP